MDSSKACSMPATGALSGASIWANRLLRCALLPENLEKLQLARPHSCWLGVSRMVWP